MAKKSPANNAITVGSRISYRRGDYVRHAVVVEDRGNVGYRGRRILRIRTLGDPEEAQHTFEIPAEDVLLEGPRAA